jgi:hypothetical protein
MASSLNVTYCNYKKRTFEECNVEETWEASEAVMWSIVGNNEAINSITQFYIIIILYSSYFKNNSRETESNESHGFVKENTDSPDIVPLFKTVKISWTEFQISRNSLSVIFIVDPKSRFIVIFFSPDLQPTNFHSKFSYSINQMHLRIIQTNSPRHSKTHSL